ncbi:MAG: hypothetical protein D3925_05265, partial [Candidatus Electrothrix sp. AR5]|nr:hypothetical protein [Candidatus Electrothrix sp. AR5]
MKTQQGGIRKYRGLITLTAAAFFAAAVLTTGYGSAETTKPQARHDILPNEQHHVTPRQGENQSVEETPVDPGAITAEHNHWRSRVGVPDLTWSDKLADVAQDWADTLKEEG